MNKRLVVLGSVAVLALVAALVVRQMAQRTIVVGRAQLGEPPRPLPKPENLVGRKAATFASDDQNGQRVGVSESSGRVVVVNVWATWCRPCVDELPRIEREIWQRFRSDITVLALADRERREKVVAFNENAKLTFSLIPDPSGRIARRYGSGAIPRTYVVGRSGKIVYQADGYNPETFPELVAAVERAVGSR